eukprot:gene27008-27238_t
MNAFDRDMGRDLAQLHYGDGDFAILKPGKHVLCAVTGVKIPLDALRYWSPEPLSLDLVRTLTDT